MRIYFISVMVCFAITSTLLAADRPVLDVPQLSDIVVDGDGKDWGSRGLRLEPLVGFASPALAGEDLVVCARAGWSRQGLFLFARVKDSIPRDFQ